MMNKVFKLIFYYILLLLGLLTASWIIWSRFIRIRTVRDIPDFLFTEYRFWILLYICFIYLYVVKNLIKPKDSNIVIKDIIDLLYKPLKILDHSIKYNKYIRSYYYKFMIKFIKSLKVFEKLNFNYLISFVFLMQIFPRIILVTFLFLDTFYFHKLEIFYKVILIGILPFLLRYTKYTIKDLYEEWIKDLESKYSHILVYDKDYSEYEIFLSQDKRLRENYDEKMKFFILSEKKKEYEKNKYIKLMLEKGEYYNLDIHTHEKMQTEAIYDSKLVSIREFIDIKHQNIRDFSSKKVDYEYESEPAISDAFMQQYIYEKYKSNKYKYDASPYTEEFLKTLGGYKHIFTEEELQEDFEIFISKKYIFDKYKSFDPNEPKPYEVKSKLNGWEKVRYYGSESRKDLVSLYEELMPNIIALKNFLLDIEIINETKIIKWSRIVIFSLYFICWSYILFISYWNYPVELLMGKYFLINFLRYLLLLNDPFADVKTYSVNKNLITKKSVKYLWNIIKEKIRNKIHEILKNGKD